MNKKYLESSEFYSARFNNFSTMIIIPIFILFVGVIFFSFIGKREITINGFGTIAPSESVANVQASVNGKVIYSSLKEGKEVKKGQILLRYSTKENKNKLDLYQIKENNLKEKISDLSLLRKGLITNKDVFTYDDKFGYRNSLNNYLSERKTYLLENDQLLKIFKRKDAKQKHKKKLDISSTYAIKENNQKIKMLQSKELQNNSQDITNSKEQLQEINNEISNIHIENKEYVVKASKTGTLHINNNYSGNKYINPGVNIAQIYPVLQKQSQIRLTAYISAADISSVKKGQTMKFQILRNVPKPIILSGKIKNIGVAALSSNKGNYYCVTSVVNLNNIQKKNLKYGMNGQVTVITGKKSFFNYYKDKLLGDE